MGEILITNENIIETEPHRGKNHLKQFRSYGAIYSNVFAMLLLYYSYGVVFFTQIDRMVYQLYGLTAEEIDTTEKNV
jgi:hypothetical protein